MLAFALRFHWLCAYLLMLTDWYTLQADSGGDGAHFCLAMLAAFCRWPDITWAYPTPISDPGAGKGILLSHNKSASAARYFSLRLLASSLSPLDGQFTTGATLCFAAIFGGF